MKHVAIVIGHGPNIDRGAVNPDGTTELDWNRDLAQKIESEIRNNGSIKATIVHRVIERVQPVKETNATGADYAIELHLNAFNGRASGTEMIYHPESPRGKRLADVLLHAAVGVLGLPNRGVKLPQGGGRGSAWLSGTRMPAVIVESFFIDNSGDLAIGNINKVRLAKAYAEALMAYCP